MDTITIGVKNSTLFVKRGALFTGSTYTIAYEGVADANVRLRLYEVRPTIENAICVAEATDDTLAMTSATWHEVFEANGYRELMTLKAYLYNADGDIVASGDVQVRMSPTKGVYEGKPVDVVGPQGGKGDKGDKGDTGATGDVGPKGDVGKDGKTYKPQLREQDGGVFLDFVEGNTTLSGNIDIRGFKGEEGKPGPQGPEGDSLFKVAVSGGFTGTEEDWVAEIGAVAGHANDATAAARVAGEAKAQTQLDATIAESAKQSSKSFAAAASESAKQAIMIDLSLKARVTALEASLGTINSILEAV